MATSTVYSLDDLTDELAQLRDDIGPHPSTRPRPNRQGSMEDARRPIATLSGSTQLLRRTASVMEGMDRGEGRDDDDSSLSSDAETFRIRPSSHRSSRSSRRSSLGILVEDRSADIGGAFAQDVDIRGFSTVGGKTDGWIVYDIEITTFKGTTVRIRRRYSEFVLLRNELHRAGFRTHRLPPKSGLAKFRLSFLERRRRLLAFWLKTVLLSPTTGSSAPARAWCLAHYESKAAPTT